MRKNIQVNQHALPTNRKINHAESTPRYKATSADAIYLWYATAHVSCADETELGGLETKIDFL